MVKAQCLWDVTIKMSSSIDSTNVLAANFKLQYWARLCYVYTFVLSILRLFEGIRRDAGQNWYS